MQARQFSEMVSRIIDEKSIHRAKALIDGAERIAIVCHTCPDGDAVGSSLAAASVLSAIGKDTKVIVPDPPLVYLRELPGAKEMVDASRYPDFAASLLNESDLIICLDFNEYSRTARLAKVLEESPVPKILIDHHLNPTIDAEVVISHPSMAATCYLLFRFFCRMELFNFIDRSAAECLLAGMMTDTGNFSYNCNDAELYIVEAELIRKGADKARLHRMLFNTQSANCLRLNSYAILRKMEIFQDCGGALITLSRDELNRFHYTKGDTEGLVNRPLAIPGVRFSVFMREESDVIRVSMRSVGDFSVQQICTEYFGGGGHLNAAGGEFYGSLEDAAALLRSILPEIKKKNPKK